MSSDTTCPECGVPNGAHTWQCPVRLGPDEEPTVETLANPVAALPKEEQLDLLAHARTTDPATSHAAAGSITSEKLRESQAAVLQLLRALGRSHDDRLLIEYAHHPSMPKQSASGIRTRRKELVDRGLVRDSGDRVRLSSGRQSIIWEVVQ